MRNTEIQNFNKFWLYCPKYKKNFKIINPRLCVIWLGPMKKYIIFISLSICPSSNTGNSYETSPQKIIANYSCLQFTNGNNSFIISILNTGFSSQIMSFSLIMNRTVRVTNHNTHDWITWNQLNQFHNGVHLWAMKIWIWYNVDM